MEFFYFFIFFYSIALMGCFVYSWGFSSPSEGFAIWISFWRFSLLFQKFKFFLGYIDEIMINDQGYLFGFTICFSSEC